MRTRAAGRVYFKNRLMNFSSAKEAIEHGFAMITEERKANGLFLKCDLTFNTTIANLDQYKSGPALSTPKMVKATNKEIKIMHTKCMGPDDMITSLSGGNQQKVIFGKWLEREPQIFMMDEPTRGIDVGAKYEIYELIIQIGQAGQDHHRRFLGDARDPGHHQPHRRHVQRASLRYCEHERDQSGRAFAA